MILNCVTHLMLAGYSDCLVFWGGQWWVNSALYSQLIVSAWALSLLSPWLPTEGSLAGRDGRCRGV